MSEEVKEGAIVNNKVGQEQIHDLLFSERLSWQSIIYDLINTEQLDPWDMDLTVLSGKFLVKVRELEEANFFVSSKVLMAAALLLRIKSEVLLHQDIPSLDDILFGKEDKKTEVQERLELDEDVPELVPRTPLPRMRKVTLQELMASLGKAINTEQRRIRRIVIDKQREMETGVSIPKRRINVHDKMKEVYDLVRKLFDETGQKMKFSDVSGLTKEERVETFMPLLHLDNQHKVVLEQEKHFGEILVWMKNHHNEINAEELEKLRREVEREIEEAVVERAIEEGLEGVSGVEDKGEYDKEDGVGEHIGEGLRAIEESFIEEKTER